MHAHRKEGAKRLQREGIELLRHMNAAKLRHLLGNVPSFRPMTSA